MPKNFMISMSFTKIAKIFGHENLELYGMLGGGGKSSCTLSEILVLATIPVHETSLANQHFYSILFRRRKGYVKRVLSVRL